MGVPKSVALLRTPLPSAGSQLPVQQLGRNSLLRSSQGTVSRNAGRCADGPFAGSSSHRTESKCLLSCRTCMLPNELQMVLSSPAATTKPPTSGMFFFFLGVAELLKMELHSLQLSSKRCYLVKCLVSSFSMTVYIPETCRDAPHQFEVGHHPSPAFDLDARFRALLVLASVFQNRVTVRKVPEDP